MSLTVNADEARVHAPGSGGAMVRGRVALPESVLTLAAERARAFHEEQEACEYNGDLVHVETLPDWLPALADVFPFGCGFHPPPRQHRRSAGTELVMTCGVDGHVDNMYGQILFICLFNDGLRFSQGKATHATAPGDWFVFDDRLKHRVTNTRKSTTYLGWAIPVLEDR